MTGPRWE